MPEPVAVIVSTVPLTLAPTVTDAFMPVFTSPNVPLAVIVLFNDMPPLLLSVTLTLLPVDTPLPVIADESPMVTLPVVLNVRFGVAVLEIAILPLPLLAVSDVVPGHSPQNFD